MQATCFRKGRYIVALAWIESRGTVFRRWLLARVERVAGIGRKALGRGGPSTNHPLYTSSDRSGHAGRGSGCVLVRRSRRLAVVLVECYLALCLVARVTISDRDCARSAVALSRGADMFVFIRAVHKSVDDAERLSCCASRTLEDRKCGFVC